MQLIIPDTLSLAILAATLRAEYIAHIQEDMPISADAIADMLQQIDDNSVDIVTNLDYYPLPEQINPKRQAF